MKLFLFSLVMILMGYIVGSKVAEPGKADLTSKEVKRNIASEFEFKDSSVHRGRRFAVVDLDREISSEKGTPFGMWRLRVKCSDFLFTEINSEEGDGKRWFEQNRYQFPIEGRKMSNIGEKAQLDNLKSKFYSECIVEGFSKEQTEAYVKDYVQTVMSSYYDDLLNDPRFKEAFTKSLLENQKEDLVKYIIENSKGEIAKAVIEQVNQMGKKINKFINGVN